MLYLTGVSTPETRSARRSDLGILATPDSAIARQVGHYPAGWAADNALFTAPMPPALAAGIGAPDHIGRSPLAAGVRYTAEPERVARWRRWIADLDPTGCLFATLPDVVGDYAATWERSCLDLARVRRLGFPVAIVLQDGVESDRFVWRSILAAADAVFVGGSTEWKMSTDAARLVGEARARGLWCHMGRVNTWGRIQHAAAIGCHSVDGTFLARAPRANFPRLTGWLDRLAAAEPIALDLTA